MGKPLKAIRFHQTGGPEVLQLEDVEIGAPQRGQALVRHTAIGVNYIDTYHRSGLSPVPELPSGIGVEAAGIVEEIGPNVDGLKPGDRVMYASTPPAAPLGAYASSRVLDTDRLIPIPNGIGDCDAAALALKGMTVEYLIRRTFPVTRGQTVLWHATAGGVGMIACQWLRALGVEVIGTVGTEEKAELARECGCTHTIVYTRDNFVERVRELTNGKGVPVVFDSVGKDTFQGSLDCLSTRGMLVSFGNSSGKPPALDIGVLSKKGSLYVTRPTIVSYTASRAELLESAGALFEVIQRGQVRSRIGAQFDLGDAEAAHRALESRTTTGSLILRP